MGDAVDIDVKMLKLVALAMASEIHVVCLYDQWQ